MEVGASGKRARMLSVKANPRSAAEAAARISLPIEEKLTRRCFDEDQSRICRIEDVGVEPVI